MSRAPILVAALIASGLGLAGLASPGPDGGTDVVGQGAVVTPGPRPESGRLPSPAPLPRPSPLRPPPARASLPSTAGPPAEPGRGAGSPPLAELQIRVDALLAENAGLRAELDAARARATRLAREGRTGLGPAIDAWIADELRAGEARVTLGDGRTLDLRRDLADVVGDVAAWARADDLDALRRQVDAGRLRDLAAVLAWWYAESHATGRQDWDERERRLQAALGLPVWNPPPAGATVVAAR